MKHKSLPLLGLAFGMLFWVADTWIDYLLFNEAHKPFLAELLHPEPIEIYMRSIMLLGFVAFGLYARVSILFLDNVRQELEREIERRRDVERILEELATSDPLTGIYNRRRGTEALRFEVERSLRYGSPLTLIMFDLDDFKRINDRFGHKTGDDVLCEVTRVVATTLRETDVFSRWGGEEFTILAPGTSSEGGLALAEKVRCAVERLPRRDEDPLTISLGIATLTDGDNPATLLDRADRALYDAKDNGKNRCALVHE